MSGAIGVVEFVLERTSNETQSISVAMERWSVEQWAFDVDTYLTLRRLMSYIYIYGAPILDVSRSHTTTQHSW